ncbi:MAG: hypothetical protein B6U88_00380 [Candidatus Aenigmarchaeota archaeon ex4484_56]|nr:MAG: hypothetical protein B6U88_00380 [Candidatus Aenigmarchaeota archaeon ex4484_56]
MKSRLLLLLIFVLFIRPNLAIDITDCANLNQSGETYFLTADIINTSTSYCMNISANNVTLDCQGHTIDGDDAADYGIYIYRSSSQTTNITIKNCIVTDWDTVNIYLENADGNNITNVTANSSPDEGIYLYSSSSNSLTDITANSNDDSGISLFDFSSSNILTDITANSNGWLGIWLYYSSSNTLTNIMANSNDEDGISLEFSNSNILINITANSNNYDGIYLYSSSSNNLTDITANSNSNYGIHISYDSDNNTIANSTIANNTDAGLYLDKYSSDDPENNTIYNCLFNNSVNVKIDDNITGENYFNTTKQLGTRIYSNGNYIGGNYWTNPSGTGYSDTCNDTDHDGFCDNPLNLSNGTSVAWDYLPLSKIYATLKVIPAWINQEFVGNKTFSSGEIDNENTTKNLYININQTKTLQFIINNSGNYPLFNLSQINSGNLTNTENGSIALNFTTISIPNNISAKETGYLNITIERPKDSSYIGNYSGWIYINSSNGEPYNYFNLTLNITITNKTIPTLTKSVYYFDENPKFYVNFYDNSTRDKLWNTSKQYNLTLERNGIDIQNISFSVNSSGLFYGEINTSSLTEGNYSIVGTIADQVNNFANINLSFELLHNLDINVVSNLNSIVKGYNFDFEINVSKLGNYTSENTTICLKLPNEIENQNSTNCTSIGNISNASSKVIKWVLKGTTKGNYTINVTGYSTDGKFNNTIHQNITVKYGILEISWKSFSSTEVNVNDEFTFRVLVKNTGDWVATNVSIDLDYDSDYFEKVSGDSDPCNIGNLTPNSQNDVCDWKVKAKKEGTKTIYADASGNNATSDSVSKTVTISSSSSSSNEEDNGNSGSGQSNYYYIDFVNVPSIITIPQGDSYNLSVTIENDGNTILNNLYLTLSGIDPDYYTISPEDKIDLNSGDSKIYKISFLIPKNFEPKQYTINLKAISDQKNETDSFVLKVVKTDLQLVNLTNNIETVQGETKKVQFYIKNTGEAYLYNTAVNLSGLPQTLYKLSCTDLNLDINESSLCELNLTIPETKKIGYYNLNITAKYNKKVVSQKIKLKINPNENKKDEIYQEYINISKKFDILIGKYKKNKNETIESKINDINETLNKIKSYIKQENYIEAENLLDTVYTQINSFSLNLKNSESVNPKRISLFLIIVVIFITGSAVGIYIYIPKKGYVPGKGYVTNSRLSKIKDLLKKIPKYKHKANTEEKERLKKLAEWRKYYEEKKKAHYD